MNLRKMIGCIGVVALSQLASGCIVVIGGSSPRCWSDEVSHTVEFESNQLEAIRAETHNGSLRFEGQPNAEGAYVEVTKRGGGANRDAASDALDAIEIVVERKPNGVEHIGWRWRGVKHWDWRAKVNFEIHSPADVDLKGLTHNGPIVVNGAAGDVQIVTHNGSINVDSQTGDLEAVTHNGRITATYAGEDITLSSHNGRIVANLSRCGPVEGAITTHNGGIQVLVGSQTSTKLSASTYNGSIRCKAPLQDIVSSKRRLVGTMRDGTGDLRIVSHNGSVRIKTSKDES